MSIELADFNTLALRRDGAVLHVLLNRPEVRNAMSLTMVRELRTVLGQAEMRADAVATGSAGDTGDTGDAGHAAARATETADAVRVIVLRGAGGHFCAGADLRDMATARARLDDDPEALVKVNAAFGDLCVAFASTGLAVVAVLEGSVMGGGFGLACVADVALAADSVQFRLPETALGVVPAQIAPFLLERLGYAEAKRLAVTGGRLDAKAALALRLVHGVHAGAALDEALNTVLQDILRCAPGAIAATKALLAQARWQPAAALVDAAARVFSKAALGPEGVEGTMAFLGKRKPSWAPQ